MNSNPIAQIRLIKQQLIQPEFKRIEELVTWMGAMQAQDFNMVKWAVGIRLPESAEQLVEEAINRGEIIRTHLMRPTWHIVSDSDVYWILELTAPHIKSGLRSRHKQLELTDKIIAACKTAIEKWLGDENHLTRIEITQKLIEANLVKLNEQVTHILAICEFDCLICSGRKKGKNSTYALLEERVAKPTSIPRDEALFKLAEHYFSSHGPATLQDFTWWSGLPVKDARKALDSVKSGLEFLNVENQELWLSKEGTETTNGLESVHLLPAYDEFIISYKDRSASLNNDNHKKAISANGFFYPVVLENGKATGIWKRVQERDRSVIEVNYFEGSKLRGTTLLKNASARYGQFLNVKTEIINPTSSD